VRVGRRRKAAEALTDRASLVALARSLQDPSSPPVSSWQRAAAIVRHQRPELAEDVRAITKHGSVTGDAS
jgi:hypothetical protein